MNLPSTKGLWALWFAAIAGILMMGLRHTAIGFYLGWVMFIIAKLVQDRTYRRE